MKRLLITLTFTLFLGHLSAGDINSIVESFAQGNISLLESVLDNTIDVALPQKNGTYTNKETSSFMKEFFMQHKSTSFKLLHNADKNNNGFLVAKYFTSDQEYRVNITYKIKNGNVYIQSIRIE